MKDRDLFIAAGIAAIAGGILAYSIVTNKEIPVAPVQLSGLEQLQEMSLACGPESEPCAKDANGKLVKVEPKQIECKKEMIALGNDKPKSLWLCGGVFTQQINQYVEENANGQETFNFVAVVDKVK